MLLLVVTVAIYYAYNKKTIFEGSTLTNRLVLKNETEVRTSPSEKAPIIKVIPAGETVLEKKIDDNWVEVLSSDNTVGWIPLWDIVGNSIKSPEERIKEKLSEFKIFLNVDENINSKEYVENIRQQIKEELELDKISIELDKTKLITEAKDKENRTLVINLSMFESEELPEGTSVYYREDKDYLLAKYIEKNLTNNYIYKVNKSKKTESLITKQPNNIRQALLVVGNTTDKINDSVLFEEKYKKQYIKSVKRGIIDYLYYVLRLEEESKKDETLPTESEIGLDIPLYYMADESYKDIVYGNNKKISTDGSLVLSLAMIEKYFNKEKSADVNNVAEWLGNTYSRNDKIKQDELLTEFADKYSLKREKIVGNQTSRIENAIKENKTVLIQIKSGSFNSKAEYVVVRGVNNNRFYINDPGDDINSLNSKKAFSKEEFEKNILQSWIIYK